MGFENICNWKRQTYFSTGESRVVCCAYTSKQHQVVLNNENRLQFLPLVKIQENSFPKNLSLSNGLTKARDSISLSGIVILRVNQSTWEPDNGSSEDI